MDQSLRSERRGGLIAVVACVAVFAVAVYGYRLGTNAIGNDDEGVHALVTRELRLSGQWLDLTIRHSPYFRKPPLSFWVRAVTQEVFGEHELTARLPSASAGVATALLLSVWAWQSTRRRSTALVAGLLFPLLPITFTHTFRSGETDALLIFLLTLGAYLLWRSLRRPWLLAAAGAVIGLAFMTKSVAAGVVPFGFVLALLLLRRWPYRWSHVVSALGAFLVVALPWHVVELQRFGSAFWDEYVGFHILRRVGERLHVTPQTHGPFWYLAAFEQGMFPWSWLALPAAGLGFERLRRRTDGDHDRFLDVFLMTWGVGTIVLFSLAQTKLGWYIAPAYPAWTLLLAQFLTTRLSAWPRWLGWLTAVAMVVYAGRAAALYQTGAASVLTLGFLPWFIAAAIAAVLMGSVVWAMDVRSSVGWVRRWPRIAGVAVLLQLTLLSLAIYSREVRRTYETPFRVLARSVEDVDGRAAVYFYDLGYVTSPLAQYYLGGQRSVTGLKEQPQRLADIVADEPGAFVIAETSRIFEPSVASRLSRVQTYGGLVLYRIPPAK